MRKTIYGLLVAGLILVVFPWWQSSRALFVTGQNLDWTLALARLTGLVAVYLLLLQVVLIGRIGWVEKVFGLDRLIKWHHRNGFTVIWLILLHPVLVIFSYAQAKQISFWQQSMLFTRNDDLLQATIAVILFLAIVGLSVSLIRRYWHYEAWYLVHLGTYLAILLSFGHQTDLGGDFANRPWFTLYWNILYAFAFGHLIWFRFLRPAYLYQKHGFQVDHLTTETADSVSVYITGRHLEQFKIAPGQFMILRFLAKGFWWQAHPFSLSAVPDGKQLRVTIKNLGDFTSQIKNLRPGTKLVIDGPHGIFTPQASTKPKTVLIAGGVGITPIRSITEALLAKGKRVALLYANKTEGDIIFKDELGQLQKQFDFPLYHILSDEPNWPGEQGYLNQEKLSRLVPDIKERDVYLCGPKPMMQAMRAILAKLGVPKNHVFYESFVL